MRRLLILSGLILTTLAGRSKMNKECPTLANLGMTQLTPNNTEYPMLQVANTTCANPHRTCFASTNEFNPNATKGWWVFLSVNAHTAQRALEIINNSSVFKLPLYGDPVNPNGNGCNGTLATDNTVIEVTTFPPY